MNQAKSTKLVMNPGIPGSARLSNITTSVSVLNTGALCSVNVITPHKGNECCPSHLSSDFRLVYL